MEELSMDVATYGQVVGQLDDLAPRSPLLPPIIVRPFVAIVPAMLEAGARGYLIKNADKNEVLDAIKSVYQQENYYCKHTTGKLARMIANSKFNPYARKPRLEFSEREREVVALI